MANIEYPRIGFVLKWILSVGSSLQRISTWSDLTAEELSDLIYELRKAVDQIEKVLIERES